MNMLNCDLETADPIVKSNDRQTDASGQKGPKKGKRVLAYHRKA